LQAPGRYAIFRSTLPKTQRQQRAEETQSSILESALRLFHERGFDAVTVEEITQDAGVSKGSFYTYFSAKSDIIVAEFWKIDDYYKEYAARNFRRYTTGTDRLLAFTRAQMRYVRDTVGNTNLKILYANQTLESGTSKIITNRKRQWYRIIREVIELGQERGEFRTDIDAEQLAQLFNRSVRSVFLDWCILDAEFDLVKEGVSFVSSWILAALRYEP
jgi:AcrR family transcriptional regulator